MTDIENHSFIKPRSLNALEGIVAGFSTRHGGVSTTPFDSLNLGLSTQDQKEKVLENRKRLFEAAGFSLDALAITGQVHSDKVLEVDKPGLYVGYDGLITRQKGILLCLSAADCASVLLVDQERDIIGACHSGWRGTVANITGKTIAMMEERGAKPDSMLAYVSPCISKDNFEVGWEVAEQFEDRYVHRIAGKEKPHVDLKAALEEQLLFAGIASNNIEVSPFCTVREKKHFFSYRAEHGKTGRMMGFVGILSGKHE